ncbi:MAG: peptidase M23 [Thalassobius sp.]|nr:peptidase M23 [Thalassovita sp.]
MDTESAFCKSLKISFFLLFLFLFFQNHQATAQRKISSKKFLGIFPIGKAKEKNSDSLLAYNDKLETEDSELTAESTMLANNFVLENEYMCEDEYLQNNIIPYLSDKTDTMLLSALEELRAPVVKEIEIPCEEQEFVMLSDSQTVIPMKYLLADEYFGVWDSKNIDPYDYELKNFNDTILLKLYEEENWSPPIKSTKINSKYGLRRWRWHHGTDLDLEKGDSVYAAFDGIVRIAKYNWGGYGYYVMLRHENGLETLYGHLTKYLVEVGQEVKAGELIGWGGNTGRSTGPHLHFETRYKGHAFDPTYLYDFDTDTLMFKEFELSAKQYEGLIDRSKSVYHRIRSGDTLSGLAVKYGTSISKICKLNGISRSTVLRIGRTLRMR